MASKLNCFHCGEELAYEAERVGRGEECPKCRLDVRVCYNCKHYDRNSYNECREPQADRVVEKAKANFCDYFSFRSGSFSAEGKSSENVLKQLDDLFKK